MNQYSQGRVLGGIGTLEGPPKNGLFQRAIELVRKSLVTFAAHAIEEGISNEYGLNELLHIFITRTFIRSEPLFMVVPQNMEDRKNGNSPMPDFGILLVTPDTEEVPKKFTVFEAKCLSTKLKKKRRQEYVIGHEEKNKHVPCGGIERFKLGKHGGRLNNAGMIGYIQDETAENWHDKINTWICELCSQPAEPEWSEEERLTLKQNNGKVAEYTSTVNRADADRKLHLTHLWIDLVPLRYS